MRGRCSRSLASATNTNSNDGRLMKSDYAQIGTRISSHEPSDRHRLKNVRLAANQVIFWVCLQSGLCVTQKQPKGAPVDLIGLNS